MLTRVTNPNRESTLSGQNPLGHSINLVGVPTELLASCAFNDHPVRLHISGVREMNKNLFEMLAQAPDLPDAGEAFTYYMMAMFGIDPEQRDDTVDKRTGATRRRRANPAPGPTSRTNSCSFRARPRCAGARDGR